MKILETGYQLVTEPQLSGKGISEICSKFGVSRKTWYKWKKRYDTYGLDGLKGLSRRSHQIKYVKVTADVEKFVLELRLNHRLGPRRITCQSTLNK